MNNGTPAFPQITSDETSNGPIVYTDQAGMSLRDYFAAAAIQGTASQQINYLGMAQDAYEIADAMLKVRDK